MKNKKGETLFSSKLCNSWLVCLLKCYLNEESAFCATVKGHTLPFLLFLAFSFALLMSLLSPRHIPALLLPQLRNAADPAGWTNDPDSPISFPLLFSHSHHSLTICTSESHSLNFEPFILYLLSLHTLWRRLVFSDALWWNSQSPNECDGT